MHFIVNVFILKKKKKREESKEFVTISHNMYLLYIHICVSTFTISYNNPYMK